MHCTGRPALGVGRNQIKGAVRRVRPTNRFFFLLFIAATGRYARSLRTHAAGLPGTPGIITRRRRSLRSLPRHPRQLEGR
jgi:hypothetical protein